MTSPIFLNTALTAHEGDTLLFLKNKSKSIFTPRKVLDSLRIVYAVGRPLAEGEEAGVLGLWKKIQSFGSEPSRMLRGFVLPMLNSFGPQGCYKLE